METRDLSKQVRNDYYRQWRKQNPDKIRNANKRYWEKKAMNLQSEQETQKEQDNESTRE